ncbi:replication initiation protein [Lactiplantibacillus plantarum]|uniref:replication initiation protein n=2 Tax=Lactiplantibacillus plantarum TaxID=1590 RepID=UPI0021CB03A5|nr:replication initiation protein [Lactiplantibacillus plantarum]
MMLFKKVSGCRYGKNKKAQKAVSGLLSRQDYLVVQGNDLAKSFGGLKSFEQRVLDYCFSFVSENDIADKMYEVSVLEVIRHFGLSASGNSYKRAAKALKTLNENTALYLPKTLPSGERGILMTQLFDTLFFGEAGTVQFRFSSNAAPLVFDLKKNFYSFHLQQLLSAENRYQELKQFTSKLKYQDQSTVFQHFVQEIKSR